jgi:capsule polysaccharide export protein KpsE/RkpR
MSLPKTEIEPNLIDQEYDRVRKWREKRRTSSSAVTTAPAQAASKVNNQEAAQASLVRAEPMTSQSTALVDTDRQHREGDRVRMWREQRKAAAKVKEPVEKFEDPVVTAPRPAPSSQVTASAPKPIAKPASAPKPIAKPVSAPEPIAKPASAPRPQITKPDGPAPVAVPTVPARQQTPAVKIDPIEEQRQRLRRQLRAGKRKFLAGITVFAVLPALLAVLYEFFVAVPLYEARSVVVVSKANTAGDTSFSGILGAVAAGGGSNINEAYMAQEYILSQTLLEDLEEDLGFVSHMSSTEVDPLRRLRNLDLIGASKRDQFSRFVRSTVNVQTGMITLFVRAPSVAEVVMVSDTILQHTEARINDLSGALFEEQVAQAVSTVNEAQKYLINTQAALSQLQIESGEANPELRIAGVYESIASVEAELLEIETQIASKGVSGRAGTFETERLAALRTSLQARIAVMRNRLVEKSPIGGQRSLSDLLLDFKRLQLEMDIGREVLSLALVGLDQTRARAALGRSQFQVVVPPLAAEVPWRPRPISSGLLVFLIAISILSVARLFRAR